MGIESKYNYSSEFYFPIENMDNETYILTRVEKAGLKNKTNIDAFENILRLLYITEHAIKINGETLKKYIQLLEHSSEKIMALKFKTRCSGSQRYQYGINSVLAVKKARYKCIVCEEKDVRCLEIDHKYGRKKPIDETKYVFYEIEEFQYLCANHHKIKTKVEKK